MQPLLLLLLLLRPGGSTCTTVVQMAPLVFTVTFSVRPIRGELLPPGGSSGTSLVGHSAKSQSEAWKWQHSSGGPSPHLSTVMTASSPVKLQQHYHPELRRGEGGGGEFPAERRYVRLAAAALLISRQKFIRPLLNIADLCSGLSLQNRRGRGTPCVCVCGRVVGGVGGVA